MRKIKLTQGKYALVDDSDYEGLIKYKWCTQHCRGIYYAIHSTPKGVWLMHKLIMGTPSKMDTDHIDGNGLNNQRKNLRICSHSQNKMNMGKKANNTSGYKCVFWEKERRKWSVVIGLNNKKIRIGRFTSKLKAYEAYCEACVKYHGEFSRVK